MRRDLYVEIVSRRTQFCTSVLSICARAIWRRLTSIKWGVSNIEDTCHSEGAKRPKNPAAKRRRPFAPLTVRAANTDGTSVRDGRATHRDMFEFKHSIRIDCNGSECSSVRIQLEE